jgi:uncharacterized protein with HEPN domain
VQPRDQAALLDILEQIRVIETHLDGASREGFLSDMVLQDAVVLREANIGEAATRRADALRAAHPEIPWRKIRDMRNFLMHVYDQIDYKKVWDTAQTDLEPLKIAVEAILAEEPSI